MSRFNLVPRDCDAGSNPKKKWYFYADFVKPTCRIEILKVKSNRWSDQAAHHIVPFVPKTKFNDFKVNII